MKSNKLKILFVASEVGPYVKSGGLGEVAYSLPKALTQLGVDIRVVLPKYAAINESALVNLRHLHTLEIKLDWRRQSAEIMTFDAPFPTYLIKNDHYFNRGHLYTFGDDFERFAFFSHAAVGLCAAVDFQPDVIHFNDWQTGLGCVYLQDVYKRFTFYEKTKALFTIHNLQYQGIFGGEVLPMVNLNHGYYVSDKLEFHGNINYMKAGLTYADHISTVSETYVHEIQTPAYSYGMDGLLRARNHQLTGILNGIDYDDNNPATDKYIFANYSAKDLAPKAENKRLLQKQLGLPVRDDVPIFAIVSRLAEQKGVDLVAGALHDLLQRDLQLIILGTGSQHFEHLFGSTAHYHPDKVSTNIMFDAETAQRIYAAADFFLMPSLFEPCGLGQLIAMRYGTLPVVRRTGGLNDTVSHYNYDTGKGNGLLFNDYLVSGLMWAVDEALALYAAPKHFKAARQNAMEADFSWTASAKKYVELYEKLCQQ